ncbi:MAG: hydroxymethylglutaryl-CoA lyase [Phycisphaerales bacterium]|nr:hydroxymethylglutaryl-CoA lyase [Phycisphaerales bacterium]
MNTTIYARNIELMLNNVRITDVAPRDGLQAETVIVDTHAKAQLVKLVQATGVAEVEVSSFVSPKWIPQLGDATDLFDQIAKSKPEGLIYSALVPNEKGLDTAIEVNQSARRNHGIERLIDKVSVFTAASEGFAQKNTNASIEETLVRFEPVVARAHEHGMMVRGYISCIIQCPFDGYINPESVGDVMTRLISMGVDEIDLGDTIGAASPETIEMVVMEAIDRLDGESTNSFGDPTLTLHLHDTFGHAADCAKIAMELGVRSFDSSAGGLGGCPYASTPDSRAPGNISTLALVHAIHDSGLSTNIDQDALVNASKFASELI